MAIEQQSPNLAYVLLVEDNEDDERFALRAIARSGHKIEIKIARDGQEALAELSNSALPRLVLLDLKIPLISGLEVLARARKDERLSCVPFVVLTSSDESSDVRGCYERGGNAYVRKPVDYNEYMRMMQSTLDFWLGQNRRP